MPKSEAPIFQNFSVEQLVMLTGYSWAYLEDLRRGKQEIRPRFRANVSRIIGQPESALFEPEKQGVA